MRVHEPIKRRPRQLSHHSPQHGLAPELELDHQVPSHPLVTKSPARTSVLELLAHAGGAPSAHQGLGPGLTTPWTRVRRRSRQAFAAARRTDGSRNPHSPRSAEGTAPRAAALPLRRATVAPGSPDLWADDARASCLSPRTREPNRRLVHRPLPTTPSTTRPPAGTREPGSRRARATWAPVSITLPSPMTAGPFDDHVLTYLAVSTYDDGRLHVQTTPGSRVPSSTHTPGRTSMPGISTPTRPDRASALPRTYSRRLPTSLQYPLTACA